MPILLTVENLVTADLSTIHKEQATYVGKMCIRDRLYISAWASALLVQTTTGSSKASNSGTSNRYRFPRFFFYSITYLINEPSGSGICWLF